MKILHTGDLHIGKSVHDFSMLEEQKYILEQILGLTERENIDVVVIAGDIYDRSVPNAEAVTVLDDFLTGLLSQNVNVIMISGNHDSPERVSFAGRILQKQGLYITGAYTGKAGRVILKDEFGAVAFTSIPYCKPGTLGCRNCQEAVENMLETAGIDRQVRNVLVTHYFVTDCGREPVLSDSETTVHVGGLDNVEAALFAAYDYVALGHIHRFQKIGEGQIYYAGAPLKYSFSEANQDKCVNIVTLKEKGKISVECRKLTPLHEMRTLRGSLAQIMEGAAGEKSLDYVQVTLTDEEELYDPIGTLRQVYPNIMQLLFTKNMQSIDSEEASFDREKIRNPMQMFEDFYREVRGSDMDDRRRKIVEQVMKEAEE